MANGVIIPNGNAENYDLTLSGATSATGMREAYEMLPQNGKTMIGNFGRNGATMFLCYKYEGINYGMMLAARIDDNKLHLLRCNNGTYTEVTIPS